MFALTGGKVRSVHCPTPSLPPTPLVRNRSSSCDPSRLLLCPRSPSLEWEESPMEKTPWIRFWRVPPWYRCTLCLLMKAPGRCKGKGVSRGLTGRRGEEREAHIYLVRERQRLTFALPLLCSAQARYSGGYDEMRCYQYFLCSIASALHPHIGL